MPKGVLYSVYLGGVLHAGWAIFHLFFPRIFAWEKTLSNLDQVNRNIYQVINLCLVFYFASAAYLSLAFAPEMLLAGLGRKILAVFGAFWLLRLGLQFRFFRATHPVSLLLSVFFLITSATYLYPLLKGAR
ncbi:MAG: hypothetical protein PVG03_05005 [Desulfarculaceae bacterium]|jgi:hypothetical protein